MPIRRAHHLASPGPLLSRRHRRYPGHRRRRWTWLQHQSAPTPGQRPRGLPGRLRTRRDAGSYSLPAGLDRRRLRYDAAASDPLGRMLCTSETFRAMTRRIREAGHRLGAPLLVCQEGGYSPTYAPFCGLAVIEELAGSAAGRGSAGRLVCLPGRPGPPATPGSGDRNRRRATARRSLTFTRGPIHVDRTLDHRSPLRTQTALLT